MSNLSSRPQATTISLPPGFAGAVTFDLFGGSGFPDVAEDGTVSMTLGSRDFFWLGLLVKDAPDAGDRG